ncbi:HD domain-containing protein [Mangrovibacterium marinum]|uniref:HD domain-containing protein n=1 Tax=Mangrovibacterium marinum TaxID=1639118 RepID=A0A2T5C0G9_9BACT|nr:HD domain-containing protein [Mangrovibacterium marinum]PTN08086.1 HD domain-containing protein [Mangrovibacterium marinum]
MNQITFDEGKLFFDQLADQFIKASDYTMAESLHMKRDHSLRVAANCLYIAKSLDLEEPEQAFIEMIGLLHDVGRFVQFQKYQHFDDSTSEDHALLGVELIAEQIFFKALDEADQLLLKEVITGHNKISFNPKDSRTLLFGQILRDADKMDNWELVVAMLKRDGTFTLPTVSYNLPKLPAASDAVLKSLNAEKPVARKDLQSLADFKLFLMSMVYDLNFKASFAWVTERQLIKKIYDSMTKSDRVIDVYRKLRLHIENRLSE